MPRGLISLLLMAVQGVSCATAGRKPVEPAGVEPRGHVEADVRFMQGMIAHHAQALAMIALVPDHAESEAIQRLARRIEVSQKDEVTVMERWLEARGETVPRGHHHGPLMPGMLTAEELAQLAGVTGVAFDRLFLELMIRHHEGALVMVADLFASGGGQEAEIFQFASHVDADQRAEIARMHGMLNTSSQEGNE